MKSEVILQNKRHLGITLIAILHFIASISAVFSINESFIILGTTFSGIYASILCIIFAVIFFIVGYGLWKLKLYAWILVIGLNIFFLIYGIINVAYYINLFFKNSGVTIIHVLAALFGCIIIILMTIYLLRRKSDFKF